LELVKKHQAGPAKRETKSEAKKRRSREKLWEQWKT
jgi:hypothetical protein